MPEGNSLWGLEIFNGLTEEELNQVAAVMGERRAKAGDFIFREDEHGDTLFVILDGEIDVTLRISQDVEEKLATVRGGSYVGEMSLVDPGHRSATARARSDCRMLTLVRRDFFELAARDNALGLKVFLNLSMTLTERLRRSTEGHRQAVLWGHQISGAANLNFYRLISDHTDITIDLLGGRTVEGVIVKVDETKSGHELTVRDKDDGLHIIPYHAVCHIAIRPEQNGALDAPTMVIPK